MTDPLSPDVMAEIRANMAQKKYEDELVAKILDKPDSFYVIEPYFAQLIAKAGIHSCVLSYWREDSEQTILIPADRVATLIDWLETVFDGTIDPSPPREESF